MRVVVTGAAGFIGRELTAALIKQGQLADSAQDFLPISELVLVDRSPFDSPASMVDGMALRHETGDLRDPAFRSRIFAGGIDSLFHLAAALTTDAERDLAQGIEANVVSLLGLLELCRAQTTAPKVVFASSIATFGGILPETVDDSTPQTPQTSYGTHKVIAEQLINDHSRHGVIDGRCLRLPIVVIRPPGGQSVSDRVAAIAREPLHGRSIDCPLRGDTLVPLVSVQAVARGLIRMHDLPATAFGASRAFNLPALSVSVADMVDSLGRHSDGRKLGRVLWKPDPALQAIVDGWPKRFESGRARQLGILPDAGFDAIIDAYLESARETV